MHLHFRNVNDALAGLVGMFHTGRHGAAHAPLLEMSSRNGAVAVVEEPVTVTYERPTERVLLNPARDANPFFHLYEALWMLAGRNDVAPLACYNSRMTGFSDDGVTLNGAYGHRWRNHPRRSDGGEYEEGAVDQLDLLVTHLRADPWSRRAVLQMWNVEDDLLKITAEADPPCRECNGTGVKPGTESIYCKFCCGTRRGRKGVPASRDVCCNLSVLFLVRPGDCRACGGTGHRGEYRPEAGPPYCDACGGKPHDVPRYLEMTVTNRSNDTLWGLLGANYVHFTVLQEYLAARLGLDVGRYHHFTNNLHVYTGRRDWRPGALLAAHRGDPYPAGSVPLVGDPAAFERELPRFVEDNSSGRERNALTDWTEPFLAGVAGPLLKAFHLHKDRPAEAAAWAARVADGAWREAAAEWLDRRRERREDYHGGAHEGVV